MAKRRLRTSEPTGLERLVSVLAHAAVVSTHGLLVGLVIFFISHSRSAYIFSQVKQALGYQVITHGLLWATVTALTLMGVELPVLHEFTLEDYEDVDTIWVMIGLYGLLQWAYGFFGAWKSFKGEEFRYLLIGDWLERL